MFYKSTVNIIFDRVGKKDPVTKGMEIVVHWLGMNIDVAFWSQHISFFLVGCIVITSIRGLLLTLTKVLLYYLLILRKIFITYIFKHIFLHSSFMLFQAANPPTLLYLFWRR